MFVISAVDSSAAVHGWCKSFQLLGLLSNVFIARMLRHRQRNDKQTNFDSVALCKVHCRENLLPKCFCVTGEKPSRILPSIKKKKPVAQDVQITLKISHSTLKTLIFTRCGQSDIIIINGFIWLIENRIHTSKTRGHFAASFCFKSSEEQRCVNVSAWHASLFVCLSQCCVGGCVNLKCFCYSACVCVTDTESVCRSLSVRACVWLWLHDNINSLSSFVTIRLYLNRINHTSHVWHAHVHSAFDSADTYMCRPTCETLASSSRELCSHNNGQQWEQ